MARAQGDLSGHPAPRQLPLSLRLCKEALRILIFLSIGLLAVRRGLAEERIPLEVELSDCSFLEQNEVLRVLSAELQVESGSTTIFEPTRVVARCKQDRLIILVRDPISGKVLQRRFALQVPPKASMNRLVGIAAAELVLASWAELSLTRRVEPDSPPPPETLVRQARARVKRLGPRPVEGSEGSLELKPNERPEFEQRPRDLSQKSPHRTDLRLAVLGSGRWFFAHPGALWGAGLRVGADPLSHLGWSADILFETGTLRTDRDYLADSWTLGTQLFLVNRLGRAQLRVGAGLRAGLAVLSSEEEAGRASAQARSIAPWGWPLAAINLGVPFGGVTFELSGEASFAVLPVPRGGGEGIRGAWFSGQLGVGYIL